MGLFDIIKEKASELLGGAGDKVTELTGVELPGADQVAQGAEDLTATATDAAQGLTETATGAVQDVTGTATEAAGNVIPDGIDPTK
jgi:hypothetical protein